jgi:hypothetical protein
MHKITLMIKPGDTACLAARRVIDLVITPHVAALIEEIDVTQDADLQAQYGANLPVILVDDVVEFEGSIDPERLARLFYDDLGERFAGIS